MNSIQRTVTATLEEVDNSIRDILKNSDPIAVKYTESVVTDSGKRLRPKLLILFVELFGGADREKVIRSAAACELLHTASLIHDDVIDDASTRRGRNTINSSFGNEHAVLVGDYILALLFSSLTELNDIRLLQYTLSACKELGAGALEEVANKCNLKISEEDYLRIISLKTGSLFKLACEMGAYLGSAEESVIRTAGEYGLLFGRAFQIVDDILDLSADENITLKPTFNDLREGRITLPIIHALRVERKLCLELISQFGEDPHNAQKELRDVLLRLGSFDYSLGKSVGFISEANEILMQEAESFREQGIIDEIRRLEDDVLARGQVSIGKS